MKKRLFLALSVLVLPLLYCVQSPPPASATYYLIRHAEKVIDAGQDPLLRPEGQARAQRWAEVFSSLPLHAIYSTDYRRTLATAAPTARAQGLEIKHYTPGKVDRAAFLTETRGQNVLVVGHSNTIPGFVNTLIGADVYEEIAHNNNGNLYVVTVSGGKALHHLLHID